MCLKACPFTSFGYVSVCRSMKLPKSLIVISALYTVGIAGKQHPRLTSLALSK